MHILFGYLFLLRHNPDLLCLNLDSLRCMHKYRHHLLRYSYSHNHRLGRLDHLLLHTPLHYLLHHHHNLMLLFEKLDLPLYRHKYQLHLALLEHNHNHLLGQLDHLHLHILLHCRLHLHHNLMSQLLM